jgi:hypothetical protein
MHAAVAIPPTSPLPTSALPGEPAWLIASRYRVLAPLGQGGMCAVYRVHDETQGRLVALKQLHPHHRSESDRLRFRREFHVLANLRHPGIVEVYEYGLDDAGPFYTMELLEGHDLSEVGTLPFAQALRVLRQVAETLSFLHSRQLVHRDLTLRNVRLDARGHARLMDFGILATAGGTSDVAGTPPYVAPETLRQKAVDPRTDLYTLGALAYRLLTGEHAFPARGFAELEELWSQAPAPPSRLRPEVPRRVDALVLSLLSMDPQLRPRSATEVVERLDALLGEQRRPSLAAAEGYLAHAPLVGRERELALMRQLLDETTRAGGKAATLLLQGEQGSGKSRMLRELGLEAQVSGATVVQVRAEPGDPPYALLEAVGRALLAAAPAEATAVATERQVTPVLARLPDLGPLLRTPPAPPLDTPATERLRLLTALSEWLLAFARRRPLVLLVDEVQACDEASAAVLVRLAGRTASRGLLLACTQTLERQPRAPEALTALHRLACRAHLHPFEQSEVEELVSSTLGEGPALKTLARWLHRHAHGVPLHTFELARHLVERGVVRYLDGLWLVDGDLSHVEVPAALVDAFAARLAPLPPPVRALAEALAVHEGELPLELCVHLAGEPDEEAVFSWLDELVRTEVLVGDGSTYRFRHPLVREALLRPLPARRLRLLHLSMGRALLRLELAGSRQVETGWHLLHGGDEKAGAGLLEAAGRELFGQQSYADAIAPLEAAVEAYERARVKPREVMELRFRLTYCGLLCRWEVLQRHAQPLLEQLRELSGLHLTSRLRQRVGLPLALLLGLAGATWRWWRTPSSRRSASPLQALGGFGIVHTCVGSTASALDDLPTLEKLIAQAEPLSLVGRGDARICWLFLGNLRALAVGDWERLEWGSREILRELERNKGRRPGMVRRIEQLAKVAVHGLHLIQMNLLRWRPEQYARECAEIDRLSIGPVEGYQACLRAAFHRLRGEEEVAVVRDTQAEQLLLQLGAGWGLNALRVRYCALSYALTRDMLGLKRTVEELDGQVRKGAAHRDLLALTRGEYHRERGELAEAEAALRRALELCAETGGLWRQGILCALAETSLARGQVARALEEAREAVALGGLEEARVTCHAVRAVRTLALAEAAGGQLESALRRLRAALGVCARLDNPLLEGLLHEALVSVALRAGATEEVSRHRARLEQCFSATGNPALLIRLQRLPVGGAPRGGPLEDEARTRKRVTEENTTQEERTLLEDAPSKEARATRTV